MSDAAGRRTPYGLIISLCLNFFLIGLIVAVVAFARMRGVPLAAIGAPGLAGGGPGLSPNAVMDALPVAGQQTFCRVLFKHAGEARRWTQRGAEGRRQMFQALRQSPANMPAFKAGAAAVAESQRGLISIREKIIIETAEQLSAEELNALADAAISRAVGRRRGATDATDASEGGNIGLARRCRAAGVAPF